MNNIISHLIRLAIDPTTTPSLQRAIVESTNVLITTSLQGNSPVRLAMVLAADLAPLSLYHKSRAVLALGQGSEDLRAVVRLLAMGLLSPGSLESLSKVRGTCMYAADKPGRLRPIARAARRSAEAPYSAAHVQVG